MPAIKLPGQFLAGFLLAFMGLLNSGSAFSQPVAEFYAGKTITLFISSTPGGGYDAYARLLSRHLGRHIPGSPTIIPKNMPGAGGLTLANYLYNRGLRDGTEIATVQNGLPFEKVFHLISPEGQNALYDSTKFGWIGSITQTVFVTVTWYSSRVKTLRDAMSQASTLGASTTGSDSHVLAVLSNNLLGTKFKIVHGYDGSTAVDLAVERGEVDGEAGKDWTTIMSSRPHWVTEKKINILLQMGMEPHPDLASVPMAIDLAKTQEDRLIMEMIFAKYGMARPFLMPPGVPLERLEAVRQAFDDTMKDAEFLAEALKLNMEISPVRGRDVEALVTKIMTAPADLAARARGALTQR